MPETTAGALRVLSTADIATLQISPAEVIDAVTQAYAALAEGKSDNPRKLTVKPQDGRSVAYAMLARGGVREAVAIKTSYKHDPHRDRATQQYYTTLTLYDDNTGLPIAMMDCGRIGMLRTPAVSALLAKYCAPPDSRTALLIGTGTQGREALPFLLETLPGLNRLLLAGTHPDGIEAVQARLRIHHPERDLELVEDAADAAAEADVILAVAGPATRVSVPAAALKPQSLCILVGYGLHHSTMNSADHVVATSAAQMAITGTDMADEHGVLRAVDAELPDIVASRALGRPTTGGRVFAYNSGLVITDIALGLRFAELAASADLGHEVPLWR